MQAGARCWIWARIKINVAQIGPVLLACLLALFIFMADIGPFFGLLKSGKQERTAQVLSFRGTICAFSPGHVLARICFGFVFLFSCLLKVMIKK